MSLAAWLAPLAVLSLTISPAVVLAQQPTPDAAQSNVIDKALGVSMTSPSTTDGKSITTADQVAVERWTGTSMTQPVGVDGKPLTGTTSFGQRPGTSVQR